jgi:hypothetical protein
LGEESRVRSGCDEKKFTKKLGIRRAEGRSIWAESQHEIARHAKREPNEKSGAGYKFEEENIMKNVSGNFSKAVRWAGIATMAAGIIAAPAVNAKPKPKVTAAPDGSKIILVSSAELPELARRSGEAMFLHETGDGRTFLYVEQNHGARLAIFDVSDPSDIKGQGMAQLDAAGVFDFVGADGDHAEIVRFREGQKEAWLDLHKFKAPVIKTEPAPKVQRATVSVDSDGNVVVVHASAPSPQERRVAETSNASEVNGLVDVNDVREQLTNESTGTTFLLTADGLHVIRRPGVELEYAAHQDQLSNPG